jgi:hypothetical protein
MITGVCSGESVRMSDATVPDLIMILNQKSRMCALIVDIRAVNMSLPKWMMKARILLVSLYQTIHGLI